MSLYTQLKNLKTEEELTKFEAELVDRFGELPSRAEDLLNSVRIKWIASKIGLEKVVMKQDKLIGYFISDQQSSFYQSQAFTNVLKYVQSHPQTCTMKEKQTRSGLRLLLTFEKINSVDKALKVLQPLGAPSSSPRRGKIKSLSPALSQERGGAVSVTVSPLERGD